MSLREQGLKPSASVAKGGHTARGAPRLRGHTTPCCMEGPLWAGHRRGTLWAWLSLVSRSRGRAMGGVRSPSVAGITNQVLASNSGCPQRARRQGLRATEEASAGGQREGWGSHPPPPYLEDQGELPEGGTLEKALRHKVTLPNGYSEIGLLVAGGWGGGGAFSPAW